jgi:PAS domain S-box-containing protein
MRSGSPDIAEQASLAQSQLAAIVDASDDAIMTHALNGAIASWNSGAERMYGYPSDAMIGRPISVLVPPGMPDLMPDVLQRIAHAHRVERFDTVHATSTGIEIDVSITASPLRVPSGKVTGVATIARDVTHRRAVELALHETERKYRTIFEHAHEGIFYVTADGETVAANPALVRLLGYDSAEEYMADPDHLLGSWKTSERQELWSRLEGEGEVRDFEMEGRRRDGTKIWVSGTMVLLRNANGSPATYQGTVLDITGQKRSETLLRRETDEADRANRAKTEFLSRMSHELRTPLTAILGFGQLLQMGRLTPVQQIESVDNILKAGRHLLQLINESVDIAGIEQGRMAFSLEPVRIGDVVKDALDLIGPAAEQRGIEICVFLDHADRYLKADRQRLVQVFLNLLSNAVKYNSEHGKVTLSCRESRVDGTFTVLVSDTGPGIPLELRDRMFKPFERLGAEKSGVEGTGLGLALSLQLVQAMGGTMALETEMGEGSTFSVTLPVVHGPAVHLADLAESPPAAAAPDDAGPPCPPCTVLYIEDNLANLEVMELVLAYRPGVKLISAMQGRLGFALAKEHHPELVLLDMRLADISGREVLNRLQGDPSTADIPVVILSAEALPGDVDDLLQAGATAYLTKPFRMEVILQLMEELLGALPEGGMGAGEPYRSASDHVRSLHARSTSSRWPPA